MPYSSRVPRTGLGHSALEHICRSGLPVPDCSVHASALACFPVHVARPAGAGCGPPPSAGGAGSQDCRSARMPEGRPCIGGDTASTLTDPAFLSAPSGSGSMVEAKMPGSESPATDGMKPCFISWKQGFAFEKEEEEIPLLRPMMYKSRSRACGKPAANIHPKQETP